VSAVSERLRLAVAARANDRCEYCRLPAQWQVARFPIDHAFAWSGGNGEILIGKTAKGRATIERLNMNSLEMVAIRSALIRLGVNFAAVE
jgi:hypothetical protein